ncbi:MAG: hypothetical protein ACK4XK_13110, partial [Casimicrobiaceae bacterium]
MKTSFPPRDPHDRVTLALLGLTLTAVLAACAPTPVKQAAPAPVVVQPEPEPAPAPAPQPEPQAVTEVRPAPPERWPDEPPPPDWKLAPQPSEIALAAAPTPSGQPRYRCVKPGSDIGTPIVLPPGTERLCSRHPAMGPCQYERDACRRGGGKVIRFDGVEIT